MRKIIGFVVVSLAIAAAAYVYSAQPAAAQSVDPVWACLGFKPHEGDYISANIPERAVYWGAFPNETYRCTATHPSPYGYHYYVVCHYLYYWWWEPGITAWSNPTPVCDI